jgi:hypothetical protein
MFRKAIEGLGMRKVDDPVALVTVEWVSPEMGGRVSGPPTAPVYAATCQFLLATDYLSETLSVLLEPVTAVEQKPFVSRCKLDFLARELGLPYVTIGAILYIFEGPKRVATAEVTEVLV